MNAEQKLKHLILNRLAELRELPARTDLTVENIDAEFSFECENDDGSLQDAKSEVRGGEVETGLQCQSSRHFEAGAVAAQAPDGSWIGWTCWSGGGKHAEPEAIEWISEAYDLAVTEEVKTVTVQTFAKVDPASAA